MKELDKAIDQIDKAIFDIDLRVDFLESKINKIRENAFAQCRAISAEEMIEIRKIKKQILIEESKKSDLCRSLEFLHPWM